MRKILVLFAHPRFEHSVVNQVLVKAIHDHPSVTFHDLYEVYPDFNINKEKEKELLLKNNVIIWHHPFYWYSCPPLLKQWIDVVLEYNWAYGHNGNNLKGKYIFNAITTGGAREAYQEEGRNLFSINDMLTPFQLTAKLCKMNYLPPFAVQGTHRIKEKELGESAQLYSQLITFLSDESNDISILKENDILNDHFVKT